MAKLKVIKEKTVLHPVMVFIFLIIGTLVLSWFLNLLNLQVTYNEINPTTMQYTPVTITVNSLLNLSGFKFIFANTVSNFAHFSLFANLLIILIGFGVMEKSGFLKTSMILLTKKAKKITVTYVIVLISLFLGIIGDISYLVMIPFSALLFLYGKRSPLIGIVTSFAALSCGAGINVLLTSIDSSLINLTLNGAYVIDSAYKIGAFNFIWIMILATIALSLLITFVTETITAKKIGRYNFEETTLDDDIEIGKRELRGILFALGAGLVYLVIFIYNIIPGLPLSGNFLDNSQLLYIDKLFSANSFFNNGFVFILAILFIILGLFYGIGSRKLKNVNQLCEQFGHSLNDIGKVIVLIFFASTFISIFKATNIGPLIVASLSNIIVNTNLGGFSLIILIFIISMIATIFVPSSIAKWSIMAGVIVPVAMNSGITPEFTQLAYRFGESVTLGITPLFAYFVIYLAYIEKYRQKELEGGLTNTIKYQLPYTFVTFCVLLLILILWFIIGFPIGINTMPVL